MIDPHATAFATCEGCGDVFEDMALAIEENGGWCPYCDAPAKLAQRRERSADDGRTDRG